jgi:hypothetical protein
MRCFNVLLALAASLSSSASLACSCAYPETLSADQLRAAMDDLSAVGYGSIYAIEYPTACRIAPVRWFNAAIGRRVPVVHKLRLRKVIWGRSARTVDVVQYQQAQWSSCRPLGNAACQPKLPSGDALWPLRRPANGEHAYAGRCGIMLATYALRLNPKIAVTDDY